MRLAPLIFLVLFLVGLSSAKIYFSETFDKEWESRWVESSFKKEEGKAGKFIQTAGKWFGDAEDGKGIQTSEDAKFYALSAKFPQSFSNKDKELVVQFTVKHEQRIDCGGAYIKLLPDTLDQANFGGDSPYYIMFGPDICGMSKKTHLIFNYNDKNHLIKKELKVESDQLSHQYTLILKPDNTYSVLIDNKEIQSGSLVEDWDFLAAKEIKDPKQSKPVDWVDVKEIDDPEDVKPADYDTIPATIVDPEATKPEDWEDEDDGEWEAPTIANPEFQGAWKAKKIPNPAYKGEWVHPLIANPDYKEDKNIYLFDKIGAAGFEIWQVKAGTIFDNIIVTDSVEEAKKFSEEHFEKNVEGEKKMFDDEEAKRQEEEKKKIEEAKKAQPAAEDAQESETDAEEEPVVVTTNTNEEKKVKKDVHDEL
ncbi:calreticulin [Cavenderia fasciculata]|uniref:Calreticulin n=1 Tax=Cavenderia fasciculata TaxID=261658 RepID=F4PV02_CACFS|nr:calreticulin [Cavenderia fasciculata]EGG21118.1 calreticulin [Cavenderia fasciculata]|eukprot:XP_004358968.1 calreticulin [Cavenderia fasciculata]